MKKKLVAASGAAFILFAAFLFTPPGKVFATSGTKIFSVWIQNSAIDSTPIGQNTASTGSFSQLAASSGSLADVTITNGSIVGSTVNSTPIGATSPSTGAFTSISSTSVGTSTAYICASSGFLTTSGCSNGWTRGTNSNGWWRQDPAGNITQGVNGLVLTCGTTDVPITFPIAFTTLASVSISLTDEFPSTGSGYAGQLSITYGSVTTTGFSVHQQSNACQILYYTATGY
jgi:hypothetical protein